MKNLFFSVISLLSLHTAVAQQDYTIEIPARPQHITTGHLNLGGSNPAGVAIDFNSFHMNIDGKPFIPIMGEIHYSCLPEENWEEQILKMKGLGVIPEYQISLI